MPLSNDMTAEDLWREANRDLPPGDNIPHFERFRLMNRAIQVIASLCYDLMSQWYDTATTIIANTTGKISSGSGTWVASTGTLTMTMGFTSNDVGNQIIFTLSTSVYCGFISEYLAADQVVVVGSNLPTTNISPDSAVMLGSAPQTDSISLADIRTMRTGQQVRLRLESTATDYVEAVSPDALRIWRPSEDGNYNKIVYALVGNTLFLNKGDGMDSYGTLHLFYPRIPYMLTLSTSKVDIADGMPAQLVIMYLSRLIAKRRRLTNADNIQEIAGYMQMMYSTAGMEIDMEILSKKVQAMK